LQAITKESWNTQTGWQKKEKVKSEPKKDSPRESRLVIPQDCLPLPHELQKIRRRLPARWNGLPPRGAEKRVRLRWDNLSVMEHRGGDGMIRSSFHAIAGIGTFTKSSFLGMDIWSSPGYDPPGFGRDETKPLRGFLLQPPGRHAYRDAHTGTVFCHPGLYRQQGGMQCPNF